MRACFSVEMKGGVLVCSALRVERAPAEVLFSFSVLLSGRITTYEYYPRTSVPRDTDYLYTYITCDL